MDSFVAIQCRTGQLVLCTPNQSRAINISVAYKTYQRLAINHPHNKYLVDYSVIVPGRQYRSTRSQLI